MKAAQKGGFTLVEVVIASAFAVMAVAVVTSEMVRSYRVFLYSRAKMEAQTIAMDTLWTHFYTDFETSLRVSRISEEATPAYSMFSTNGLVRTAVLSFTDFADIVVQVWPSPALSLSDRPAIEYRIRRYNDVRLK